MAVILKKFFRVRLFSVTSGRLFSKCIHRVVCGHLSIFRFYRSQLELYIQTAGRGVGPGPPLKSQLQYMIES